jgi:hypothetical protein
MRDPMAKTTEHRSHTWAAFAAGAVSMLAIVLLWAAWTWMQDATSSVLRADLALPRTPSLPSLPTNPPPTGPKLPQIPLPGPR